MFPWEAKVACIYKLPYFVFREFVFEGVGSCDKSHKWNFVFACGWNLKL